MREAVSEYYSSAEADELYDGQCIALWWHLIGNRQPRDPVAYFGKIFSETPYLDTHLANAGSEEDWELAA